MPIYTKTGDSGETSIGTKRKPKDCQEAEVIGEIDELASLLGIIAAEMEDSAEMEKIIATLMQLNAHIMSEGKYAFNGSAEELEKHIDKMWSEAGELHHFILRFTDQLASKIHYARALCRRVERKLVAFARDKNWIDKKVMAYMNRLSDYLFALARWTNKRRGGKEVEWTT